MQGGKNGGSVSIILALMMPCSYQLAIAESPEARRLTLVSDSTALGLCHSSCAHQYCACRRRDYQCDDLCSLSSEQDHDVA